MPISQDAYNHIYLTTHHLFLNYEYIPVVSSVFNVILGAGVIDLWPLRYCAGVGCTLKCTGYREKLVFSDDFYLANNSCSWQISSLTTAVALPWAWQMGPMRNPEYNFLKKIDLWFQNKLHYVKICHFFFVGILWVEEVCMNLIYSFEMLIWNEYHMHWHCALIF